MKLKKIQKPSPIRVRTALEERASSGTGCGYFRNCVLTVVDLVLLAFVALIGTQVYFYYKGLTADPSTIMMAEEASSESESISYRKIGEGTLAYGGNKFLLYAAEDTTTNQPISVKTWARSMAENRRSSILAQDLTNIIRDSQFRGIFLETPGVTSQNADTKQMRVGIIEGESLSRFAESQASSRAFAEHLDKCPDKDACRFANLGGDAQLIAPQKKEGTTDVTYSHLAAFLRRAPSEQVAAVWQEVASTYHEILQTRDATRPVWLSTAGEGVPWLHFRLDDRPKYYHYTPFAQEK